MQKVKGTILKVISDWAGWRVWGYAITYAKAPEKTDNTDDTEDHG